MASFREEIVQMAILYSYAEFTEAALEVIPPGLSEHIGPNLPEIYMQVREELSEDLVKCNTRLQSRCKKM